MPNSQHKNTFDNAAQANATLASARAYLKEQEKAAIDFLDNNGSGGLLGYLHGVTENLDGASLETKIKAVQSALMYLHAMNKMADGRPKLNETIFKKYIPPIVQILRSINFSDDFTDVEIRDEKI